MHSICKEQRLIRIYLQNKKMNTNTTFNGICSEMNIEETHAACVACL